MPTSSLRAPLAADLLELAADLVLEFAAGVDVHVGNPTKVTRSVSWLGSIHLTDRRSASR